ncbi:retrotransposon protein, putative, ty1-copia subclass [Tanacetum coccineum]|uniref:Retrotransposon protein, putative, ty1-copia subclass n=1 Tax=Tanacetum coccineum TaxID=301880 RepID=A0ABQ4X0T3_9ASTR
MLIRCEEIDPPLNWKNVISCKSHNVLGITPVAIIDRQLPFEYSIASRSTDVMVIKGYVEQLEHLGYVRPRDIGVGLILNGPTSDFARFVRNYNMHNMGKTIGELHALLIEYEKGLPKKAVTPQVMAIQGGRIQKANKKSLNAKGKGKGNGKGKDTGYIPKRKNPKPPAKEHPTKDDARHHCKEVGHWKKNCLVYLAELIKKKIQVGTASSSSIFTIELFPFPNRSWVYGTGCGTYVCNTKHGLRGERKLKQGPLYLYMGNGVRAQVEAIKSYDLILSNGLVICLENCHYAPTITRYVVSVSRLVDNGFIQYFTDYGILVSKNDVLYFNVIPSNGIYEIDMINHVPNGNSIYNVSNKRVKHYLDSTYLWHCRLAHIRKKRIEKPQHDGILKSTDEESFDKCESCLSGKMTRKSFPHRTERATDLFGIVHTDLTPPYTPEHNLVSERRNHTLLDMVRSMMNPTTLPLSFWDYTLETATCILNMVPTKKVDKTSYELRYGKASNLSYLKETMGYYFYFPPKNKIIVAMYAEFLKKNLLSQEVSGRAEELEEIQDKDTSPCENTSKVSMEVKEVDEYSLRDLNRPANYKAAILDPEFDKWVDAMNVEMQSMKDNQVWCLVDLLRNCKTIGSKWLFNKKTDMDGIVHTYKARLVSKGYTQTYGVDYEETFSPVADIIAIRIFIAISAFYDYEI